MKDCQICGNPITKSDSCQRYNTCHSCITQIHRYTNDYGMTKDEAIDRILNTTTIIDKITYWGRILNKKAKDEMYKL